MSSPAITVIESRAKPVSSKSWRDLDGTLTLTKFIFRRERKRILIWLLVFVGMLFAFESFVSDLTSTPSEVADMARFLEGATGALFGPGYGRADITADKYIAGVYASFFYIPLALLSINLVARHTRTEEQNGHAELIRSNVVGRSSQLTAAMIVAAAMNMLYAVAIGGVMTSAGYDSAESFLFGASVGMIGILFAGVSALTSQLTESPRSATAYAGAVLAVAWVIRLVGDLIEDYGSPLSWVSPLALSQQTRPYVDGRWWPLALTLALTATAAGAGYMLLGKRDIGAGIIPNRPGAPTAVPWLRSSVALTYRLLRGSILWWTVGLAAMGFVFGAVGDEVANTENISAERVEMFGGSIDTVFEGFLGVLTMLTAILTSVMMIKGVSLMRQEEVGGRLEPLLATDVSRTRWFGGYLTVLLAGAMIVLLAAGLATGLGAWMVMDDGSFIADATIAHLAYIPALLVSIGLSYALFGLSPRYLGFTWVTIALGVMAGLMSRSLNLPGCFMNLSPFEQIGSPMLDGLSVLPTIVLTVLGLGLIGLGFAGFQRRDLTMK